jgi:heme/copper-type cytochrome/quinol oxidase subunit 3
MWGIGSILSYKEECDIRQNNSLNTFKSHSHNKSSPWFIFWLLSELVVFVIFFYWIFVPDIGFNIIEAIRKVQNYFYLSMINCMILIEDTRTNTLS